MHRTALLVIDLQQGAFDGVRCPPIDHAERLVKHAGGLVAAARAAGTPIVFVQHCDEPGAAFEEGTPHFEFHPDLSPQPGDGLIRKRQSSAFEGTELAPLLEGLGVDAVVLCGLQSEFCVSNTARSALKRGLRVTIAHDAHGTWPCAGETAEAIRAQANQGLQAEGARLAATAELVQAMRRTPEPRPA